MEHAENQDANATGNEGVVLFRHIFHSQRYQRLFRGQAGLLVPAAEMVIFLYHIGECIPVENIPGQIHGPSNT